MAQAQQDYRHYQQNPPYATQTQSIFPEKGPSPSQVLALATLLPFGAFLLMLAGITLTGTVVGLAVTTPLFVIFSPVLLPAALVIGLAVTGFLTSGAFGVTALSSFTWLANYLRRSRLLEQLEFANRRAQETMGQSVKESGEAVQSKVQEAGQEAQNKAQESGQKVQSKTRASGKTQEERSTS